MASAVPVLFVAVLLAAVDFGSCIRCFQCNSQQDPSCNDPFAAGHQLQECQSPQSDSFNRLYLFNLFNQKGLNDHVPNAPKSCYKIVMQTGTTFRTCLDVNPNDPSYTCRALAQDASYNANDISRQIKHCSACDRDGCNAAGSIVASLPLAFLTAAVSYLFFKQ